MKEDFYKQLANFMKKEQILLDEPMSKHTTFRVGGPADYFIIPKSIKELQKAVTLSKQYKIPYYIIGNGSNILVSDDGYRGVIIQIYKELDYIEVVGETIYVQAGVLLSKIANEAFIHELTGVEFAAGIPGTLGGACMMNAGAYGGEMKDVLQDITVLDENGNVRILQKDELALGYRTSVVAKRGYIVLGATLVLEKGVSEMIRSRMEELRAKRIAKQPLEYPSAGSTFKRPKGHYAGQLIQEAGLCGFQVGGAQVSEKHCGFIINKDQATATDVLQLMNEVVERVRKHSGVTIEPEVKRLGEF
ncbi:MAG: UDP-N-acetylmuramate dehydrogenase [Lachnospiraceae bacterium]